MASVSNRPHATATPGGAIALAWCIALAASGCEDLRQFAGSWSGAISRDPQHQLGFGADASLSGRIASVTRSGIDMTVTLPGENGSLRFELIRHAAGDVLADVRFAGEPLRTFFGFVSPPAAEPYLAIVSLYAADRVEIRLIRGPNQAYGVFALERDPPP
jgi:hypothetical protein